MTKPKTTQARAPRTKAAHGPPPDDTVKQLAKLSKGWREDAEDTLLVLQKALRDLVSNGKLSAFEILGGIKTVGEALTTNQALIPAPKPAEDKPAAPKPEAPTEP